MRYFDLPRLAKRAWGVPAFMLFACSLLAVRPATSQTIPATAHAPAPVNLNNTDLARARTPMEVTSGTAKLIARYAPTNKLRLVLGLTPPKLAAEEKFLAELQDRKSPNFHKYLTAEQWNARFAPSAADEQAVADWATTNGLTVTKRYPNRLIVDVEGTASTIEKAFAIQLNSYQVGARTEFSNDRDPVIPAHLAGILHSVGGLNSIQRLQAPHQGNINEVSPAYAAGEVAGAATPLGKDGNHALYEAAMKAAEAKHGTMQDGKSSIKGSGVVSPGVTNGYIDPADIFSSYGYDYGALMRQGHCCNPLHNAGSTPPETTIAVATAGDFADSDIYGFQAQYPYLASHWNHRYIDGTAGCCNDESTLDMEWTIATANSEGSLVDTAFVWGYVGVNNYLSTFTDVYNQMLSDGYARIFSTSWGCREFTCQDSGTMDTNHAIFNSMLGQGWTLAALSHDQGAAADCYSADGVSYPGSDPDVVSVGGTSLGLYSDGTFASETAWEGGHGSGSCSVNGGGSGGGCSSKYAAPGYQSTPYCGTGSRSVPDVALNAGYGQNYYFSGGLHGVGGTSISTPQVAGFMAQENAYLLAIGTGCGAGFASTCAPMGQADWAMYREGYNHAYATHYPFYDITVGCNSNDITDLYGLGYYCAGAGYDAVTGWGSFNALQLSWTISSYYSGGYSNPTVAFSGPPVSTTSNTWYNSDQTVNWTVTANACCGYVPTGIAGFSQAWDAPIADATSEPNQGTGDSFYSGPQFTNVNTGYLQLSWAGEGCHYATVDAWDNTGFTSGNNYYYWICYDVTPPTISESYAPAANGYGWDKSNVTVTLTATDPNGGNGSTGSGVANTYYAVDTGSCYPGSLGACSVYTGPFTFATEGVHYVYYFTQDVAGNSSSEPYVYLYIDKTPPVTTATLTGTLAGSYYTSKVTVTLGATDATSGVLGTRYQLDAGANSAYTTPLTVSAPGAHTVKYYSEDRAGNFEAVKTVTFTINSPTTTGLGVSANPAILGSSVTLTATVTPTLPGTPTGTVSFYNGASLIGSGTVAGGVATFSTSSLPLGNNSLSAVYGGATNYLTSTSSAVVESVLETTTTQVFSNLNPAALGHAITFTAKVKPSVSGLPTGAVTFYDGATLIGTGTLSGGAATMSITSLLPGTHTITAKYAGNVDYQTSLSPAYTETVTKGATTTYLTPSVNPSTYTQAVTFTAKVVGFGGTPTGTVNYYSNGSLLGTTTLSAGVATLTTSALTVGTHTVFTQYLGDSNFLADSSSSVAEVTTIAKTTAKVTSSLNPSVWGKSVTLTGTVTPVGTGTPTGTITFSDGATVLGTKTLSGGSASLSISTLTGGTHPITISYSGSSLYAASSSGALNQVVNHSATTTTLVSSLNPATHGTAVTFTATVTAASGPTPPGTVSFRDGSTTIGTGTLIGAGVATFATSSLTVGTHSITAFYPGDGNHLGSLSTAVSQVIH